MSLEEGSIFNEIYKILKTLGKGTIGDTYLLERIEDNKKFVLKELNFSEESGSTENAARDIFFRQSDFMKKCNHPGLPQTYEGIFNKNGQDYIIMDYVEGKNLEEIINSSPSPLSPDEAVKWTIKLSEILGYLHTSFHTTIIHRNVKPSNIIITPEGSVKLVDFGVVRYYKPDKETDTFRFGVPGYAAPEQYKGGGQSTPQSDIYSLGVILFQMLTKYDPTERPFKFPNMESLNSSLSSGLKEVVTKAIDLDSKKRYRDMQEFKDALKKVTGAGREDRKENKNSSQNSNKAPGCFLIILMIMLILTLSDCVFYKMLMTINYYL